MFAIGIGPSSSHTVGPMKAGLAFVSYLENAELLSQVTRLKIDLYGSLALTGDGHGTFVAVLNGLSGEHPATIDPTKVFLCADKIKMTNQLLVAGRRTIDFHYNRDLIIHKNEFLPEHPNGMRFTAFVEDKILYQQEYFSIGGGFIVDKQEFVKSTLDPDSYEHSLVPYPFSTAEELFTHCNKENLTVAQLVLKNELINYTKAEIYNRALEFAEVMHQSVMNGIIQEGILPGGLKVNRRAPNLYRQLAKDNLSEISYQNRRLLAMTYAIAVNEENAAFSRVVTAPTNGSAGTIPGVLEYYRNFYDNVNQDKIVEFMLTAGAIGVLYKHGASISAAEVGCQGEIGVASSMAAGALTAVLGGSLIQVEKAAEIAMEHFLGMTCDPIAGLVQIPCIERNGIAASKAIDIANLVLLEDAPGMISLDDVIKTMLETGRDMNSRYKETALGGLAVNVVNC